MLTSWIGKRLKVKKRGWWALGQIPAHGLISRAAWGKSLRENRWVIIVHASCEFCLNEAVS